MNHQCPYYPFQTHIFRTPYFPLNVLTDWFAELDNSDDYLKITLSRSDIQEAIFLASHLLHEERNKFIEDRLKAKDRDKFFFTVLKYLSRMGSRCTPFGLFAGCSVGHLGERTEICLPNPECYTRHSRLDMNYLCALAQDIANKKEMRDVLLYYPNNSSYVVGDKLRYVECKYHKGNRHLTIAAINHADYLQCILEAAQYGASMEQMVSMLIEDENDQEEAIEFIEDIIDNQVLVSELAPSITGVELLDQLIALLTKFEDRQEFVSKLRSLFTLLQSIDLHTIGTTIPIYAKIKEQIATLGTAFNEKHLFQSDMIKPCEKAEIDKKIADEILEAITFINKLSPPSRQETLLDKLASTFLERYDEREIALGQLLDNEMGLSFRESVERGDVSPLLETIPFGIRLKENNSHNWSGLQSLLHRKVVEALQKKEFEIILTDEDVKGITAQWDDLPHTIAVMCEIFSYKPDGSFKFFLHSIGGSSAANLLGRFCHVDKEIHNAVLEIIKEEERSLSDDKLYAEIVHLPESRTGNILARPVLRQYEIPYLAKSAVGKDFQLEISDLMVSVKNRKFVLRSKRLKKEIIPRLTTAHNFSNPGALPIYQFLWHLQNQHYRGGIGLFLSSLFDEFPFLPRMVYKNTFLSLARWRIKPDEIKPITDGNEKSKALEALKQWKEKIGIPRFVVLPDGDNELFTDTESITSMRMLYSVVKKRPYFFLREFPFDTENAILKTQEGAFTNEFLFTFYKGTSA